MARYTGPKGKLERREGVNLFLKGARSEGEKSPVKRRNQPPGQHGAARRRRPGGYELQLREKQKAKRIYGVLEKQFGNYVKKALREKEVTGQALMQLLESRFDNVVRRSGLAASHAQARQLIGFGYFAINGRMANIPSIDIKVGDEISVIKLDRISPRDVVIPEWLSYSADDKKVKLLALPTLEQLATLNVPVNPQLIVEYYSR